MHYIPILSTLVTFAFAAAVLNRYRYKKGPHLLLWGIGLILYGLGTLSEVIMGFTFNALVLKVWYLSGAMLTAAWLGQGTIFLLVRRNAFFTVQTTLDRDTFENLLNSEVEINYDEWESFRLEFDPATMTVRCTLNGETLGEYTPPNADFLREGEFIHELRWYVEPNQTVATDFDNITLELAGAGAGQPPAAEGMVYDTFDDASFDGGYNTALWLLDEDSICAFQQAGGVITVPGAVAADDTWCLLEMITPLLGERAGSLRADLLIGGDHNGGYVENLIRLGMHVDGGAWWYADCGLAAEDRKSVV